MTRARGSFLIICLVLMTLIAIVSFAVLRDITAEVDVSTTNQRYLLAQQAAHAGFDQAVEQILIGYNQTSITLPAKSGTVTVPALTFLDGAYRAPFTAIHTPNNLSNQADSNDPTLNDDDVRQEDYVLRPWAWWWFDVGANWNTGYSEYDGKGRYYEPGFYNTTPAATGVGYPVAPTNFVNLGLAAVPERAQGIFYDEQFRRVVPSGNPLTDRLNARYRLRYTVGVEDLEGHLLCNPMPDMQMLSDVGLPVDYRNPAQTYPWMPAAQNALGVIAGAAVGAISAAQLEHTFQGRGYHTNIDFDHVSTGGLSSFPKTFPLMYRSHPEPNLAPNPPPANPPSPLSGEGGWEVYDDGHWNSGSLTNQLYYTSNNQVKGLAAGGEFIPTGANGGMDGSNFWPYNDGTYFHCLMGPQLSPADLDYAAHGESAYTSGNRGWDDFVLTPFGHVMQATPYTPGQGKWYQAHVTTPFHINVLTAPPALVNEMLLGYLPPAEKIIQYTSVTWEIYGGASPGGGSIFTPIGSEAISGTNSANWGYTYGRDLLVNTTAPPAFGPWPPPIRSDSTTGATNPPGATGIGQVISPDYYATDTRLTQNPVIWPYPGRFMCGSSAITGQGSDDLGTLMNQASLYTAYDAYTHGAFCSLPGGNPQTSASNFISGSDPFGQNGAAAWATAAVPPSTPPWGTHPQDYAMKSPPAIAELHNHSYYLDMVCAMGTAIGVLRAEYVQYDFLGWLSHTQLFGKGISPAPCIDPAPQNYLSLRDLDGLFLAEMGESLTAPGSGPPASLFVPNGALRGYQFHNIYSNPLITSDFVPENNIYSLVKSNLIANQDNSVSSVQRGHIMELMLNDFRMSFLGSSPAYSDGLNPTTGQIDPAYKFMPLDFDGDGMVYCSCFTTLDADGLPCAPAGTAPPCYFTIDGMFFMGKSHYYRIFSRGEIWDNLLRRKVDSATLDSVIAIDPEGTNPLDSQVLYQRWLYDRYYANITHVQR